MLFSGGVGHELITHNLFSDPRICTLQVCVCVYT